MRNTVCFESGACQSCWFWEVLQKSASIQPRAHLLEYGSPLTHQPTSPHPNPRPPTPDPSGQKEYMSNSVSKSISIGPNGVLLWPSQVMLLAKWNFNTSMRRPFFYLCMSSRRTCRALDIFCNSNSTWRQATRIGTWDLTAGWLVNGLHESLVDWRRAGSEPRFAVLDQFSDLIRVALVSN